MLHTSVITLQLHRQLWHLRHCFFTDIMPAEDDSKQETENIHLFQMQGADYTNSKHFALKPEPDSYDLFQQWTYVEQHLQQRDSCYLTQQIVTTEMSTG